MTSLTQQENATAESAFRSNDEGSKGFLHSKEFFYACQSLGFEYTFVECFEMYKIFDDNNSLRMNLDEFKRFYEAKLEDPNSNIDPSKVSNVYTNRTGGDQGSYIPQSNYPAGTYTHGTTTVSQTTGPSRVVGGGTTSYGNGGTTTSYGNGGTTTTTHTTSYGNPSGTTTSYGTGAHRVVGGTTYGTTTHTTGSTGYTGGRVVSSGYTGGRVIGGGTTTLTGGYIVGGNEMSKYDTEGKGYITKDQLAIACQDLAVKCDTQGELDDIWDEIDTNGTGRVNSIEFGEFYDYVRGFRDIVRQRRAGGQ